MRRGRGERVGGLENFSCEARLIPLRLGTRRAGAVNEGSARNDRERDKPV